jgi:DNA-binding CsgD family transcriptional regulator
VATEVEAFLGAGQEALEAGEWEAARAAFEQALERDEAGEALYGLGTALYWLTETEAAVHTLERAHAEFCRRPDPDQAAFIAIELSLYYSSSLGNLAAAQGWLRRAARLVADHGLVPLEGWIALTRAGWATQSHDPHAGEDLARQALDLAREGGDGDLELCALAELGAALLEGGQVSEGLALLDESMAGALGGDVRDVATVIYASCRTIECCARAAEIKRAVQWIRAAGEFNRRYGSAHIHAICRTHYGAVLFGLGRWAESERELNAALRMSRTAEPALHAEALAKLAELRLAQGRLEEAARLLEGLDDHRGATVALASLYAARGELGAASSLLARRLREMGDSCLGCAELLELLGEVEIEHGAIGAAQEHAQRLSDLREGLDCELVTARAERAQGRVLGAAGDRDRALVHLERSLSIFVQLELALEAARTRLLLAGVFGSADPEAAVAVGRAALDAFEAMGAAREADRAAALLRSLGAKAARSAGPRGIDVLTKREREVLGLLGEGLSNRQMAERLFLSTRTVEHHVRSVLSKLDLTNRAEAAAYVARSSGAP